jgi:uncharacterized protein
MDLVHDFTVPVSADQAFDLLVDVSRIAPCMPGATVTAVDGDTFQGGMKVKVGPIAMTFKGEGEMIEIDQLAKRAVLRARGRDAKGNGGAQATVTATLAESNGLTTVHVVTDLDVTGKAAQFGSGVMKDISNGLFQQFADNVAEMVRRGGDAQPASSAPEPGPDAVAQPPAETTDQGLDALGLMLGSETVRKAVRSTTMVLLMLLLVRNRNRARRLRRARRAGHPASSVAAGPITG